MFRHAATTLTAHVSTTAPSRPSDAPAPHGRVVNGRGRSRRPHVFPLVFGLIDARVGRQGELTGIVMVKRAGRGSQTPWTASIREVRMASVKAAKSRSFCSA